MVANDQIHWTDVAAVLFDFDGVLVDTEWAIYSAWQRTFAVHGHDLPLSLYTRCIGSDFATWSPKSYLEDLTGMQFDWQHLDTQRQLEIHSDLSDSGPMPGVHEMLAWLGRRQIPKAVVSSSSRPWVDGWLEKLSLRQHFARTVCRGDAPRIKPAPDLYLAAADQLGIEPRQCLVIEDSLNGLIAAKEAGMNVWVVPNRVTDQLDFSAADRVWKSLAECIPKHPIETVDASQPSACRADAP